MSASNLAVCLATNFIKEPPSETNLQKILENTNYVQKVLALMINESDTIWSKVQLQ